MVSNREDKESYIKQYPTSKGYKMKSLEKKDKTNRKIFADEFGGTVLNIESSRIRIDDTKIVVHHEFEGSEIKSSQTGDA